MAAVILDLGLISLVLINQLIFMEIVKRIGENLKDFITVIITK